MLLSRGEIQEALASGEVIISPDPVNSSRIQPASLDLRLGPELMVHSSEPVRGVSIDPAAIIIPDFISRYCDRVDISTGSSYEIQPMGFVLGETLERVEIPLSLAARVEGKSSLARLGMTVHITAPKIDPGFRGNITLEMFNLGPFPLKLSYGMDICSLMLERLGRPVAQGYTGRFQGE